MTVTVRAENGTIIVSSPYDKGFVNAARQLGGKWDGTAKTWEFDVRYETQVREILRSVYGTDGLTPTATVALRIVLDELAEGGDELRVAGRTVAKKFSRDAAPRLGDGCAVIAGKFKEHGGSRNSPRLTWSDGTIVEVLDVPLPAAQALVDANPDAYSIVAGEDAKADDLTPAERALVDALNALDWDRLERVLSAVTVRPDNQQ